MPCKSDHMDDIKRKLRSLKKLEIKIRFGGMFHAANIDDMPSGKHQPGSFGKRGCNPSAKMGKALLVWDDFFCLDGDSSRKARYSLEEIASMDKEEYKNAVDEFFFRIYYKYYTENGITGSNLYDPDILSWMGLPPDAGSEEIKKKFRELAKKYHPDTGGDEGKFIELMDKYQKLPL